MTFGSNKGAPLCVQNHVTLCTRTTWSGAAKLTIDRAMRRWLFVAAVLAVALLGTPARAQDGRTVYWERWDVAIDNVDAVANRFDVAEIYDIQFSGRFTFGTAVIPALNLDSIDNV